MSINSLNNQHKEENFNERSINKNDEDEKEDSLSLSFKNSIKKKSSFKIGKQKDNTKGEKKKITLKETLRFVNSILEGNYFWFITANICILITSSIQAYIPRLCGNIVDSIAEKKEVSLNGHLGLFISLIVVTSIVSFFRGLIFEYLSEKIIFKLQFYFFTEVMFNKVQFFEENKSGELISRFTSDMSSIRAGLSDNIGSLIRNVVQFLISVSLIFYLDKELAAYLILIILPSVYIIIKMFKMMKSLNNDYNQAKAESVGILSENFLNIRVVKAFNAEIFEINKYSQKLYESFSIGKTKAFFFGLMLSFFNIIAFGLVLFSTYYGGMQVIKGRVSIGELSSFLLYATVLSISLTSMSGTIGALVTSKATLEGLFDLVEDKNSELLLDENIELKEKVTHSIKPSKPKMKNYKNHDISQEGDSIINEIKRKFVNSSSSLNEENNKIRICDDLNLTERSEIDDKADEFKEKNSEYRKNSSEEENKKYKKLRNIEEEVKETSSSLSKKFTTYNKIIDFNSLINEDHLYSRNYLEEKVLKQYLTQKVIKKNHNEEETISRFNTTFRQSQEMLQFILLSNRNKSSSSLIERVSSIEDYIIDVIDFNDKIVFENISFHYQKLNEKNDKENKVENKPKKSFDSEYSHISIASKEESDCTESILKDEETTIANPLVLNKINLEIPIKKKVGIVGESGSGKSTLTALLLKFYKPSSGRILIDGLNLNNISFNSLRNLISYVPQEPAILSGTILSNILYGIEQCTESEIEEAIEISNCGFIYDKHLFPNGINTIIGEKGVRLSGGQKQRIAIARAILKNPKIYIFDEATTSLDSASEHLVQEAVDNVIKRKNCTATIVSHRLSTIKNCDKIFVVKKGKIIAEGNHAELSNNITNGGNKLDNFNTENYESNLNNITSNTTLDGENTGKENEKAQAGENENEKNEYIRLFNKQM